MQEVRLSLDVLMLTPGNLPTASLEQQVVQPAVAAQLDAFGLMLSQEEQLCDLRALHFQPPGWPHPLTVVYPMRSGAGAGKVCLLVALKPTDWLAPSAAWQRHSTVFDA